MNRINNPKEYIGWLKNQPIYSKGELDALPQVAIIIHDSLIVEHLALLGYGPREYFQYNIGATDPISFFKVRDKQKKIEFLLMGGLPGIGGITTQVSELIALGVKQLVHIGTCGLVGNLITEGTIIVSKGSYCGDRSELLSDSNNVYSKPSHSLQKNILKYLSSNKIEFNQAYGFTTPIFYNQPVTLITNLINESITYQKHKIGFVEMEQGGFFNTCELMKVESISIVTGSDRYILKDDKLSQIYYDHDVNKTKLEILQLVIDYFASIK